MRFTKKDIFIVQEEVRRANCSCGFQFNHQATCACRLQTGIPTSVTELMCTYLVAWCVGLSAL